MFGPNHGNRADTDARARRKVGLGVQTCSSCGETKALGEFNADPQTRRAGA